MSVEGWSSRLAYHFQDLRSQRLHAGGDRPVFALEHGLSSEEVSALQSDIREQILRRSPSDRDMLAWIVYATEIGYQYEGYEFWQTFDGVTPGWAQRAERHWIRHCFKTFTDTYGGASPAGTWAAHFSIICWPITHAILPKDLQRHLAKILYELRYQFSREIMDDPNALGDMVARTSWLANSRFQEFAQNSPLVGQISAALLVQGQEGTKSLILPLTLERIRRDLDDVRAARDWLRDASRYAQKARLEGLSRRERNTHFTPPSTVPEACRQVRDMAIEPHLILRPTQEGTWGVFLALPNLSQMTTRFPSFGPVLANSRCRVTGSSRRWQARGWLLYGSQTIPLVEWPRADQVLLEFEKSTSDLSLLLRTECLLRPGPISAFKVASDGLAHQLHTLGLRPGQQYVIVSTSAKLPEDKWLLPIVLDCANAYGAILDMPGAIPPELERFVRSLGLHITKTVSVRPAGLTASRWDGEGTAEWISSERPCISVTADHDVSSISVMLDNDRGAAVQLTPAAVGRPMFIGFPTLPVGVHLVEISVTSKRASPTEESGYLELVIRGPLPWQPGIGSKTALTVLVEPRAPSLEQLWENRVDVQLLGPRSRTLSCEIAFFTKDSPTPVIASKLPNIILPMDSSSWQSYFRDNIRDNPRIACLYDDAQSCTVSLDAAELGSFVLNCQREFQPMRWQVRSGNLGYVARLLDDSGVSSEESIFKYEFQNPDVGLALDSGVYERGFEPVTGGLYYATHDEYRCGVIIPDCQKAHSGFTSFQDLGLRPEMKPSSRSTSTIVDVLDSVERWSSARLTGDTLSAIRQQQVVDALTSHVVFLICGKRWAAIEEACRKSARPPDRQLLARGVSDRTEHNDLRNQLCSVGGKLSTMATDERIVALAKILVPHLALGGVRQWANRPAEEMGTWLAEFALRLASKPAGIARWAAQYLHPGIDFLLVNPIMVRAARFMTLSEQRQSLDWGREQE